jgi:hypothetical protein
MNEHHPQTKAVVTVSEMARMCGLSRSRFYQLIGSAFPEPSRDPETNRPFFDEDGQRSCLEVRRRNQGIDGEPILFYARRPTPPISPRPRPTPGPKPSSTSSSRFAAVAEGVRALGLSSVTDRQVEQAVREVFPNGTPDEVDSAEVIRAVFVRLMRRNTPDNVGR